MEPSSSSGAALGEWLDRAALGGLVVGLGLYVMPFWAEGRLRVALWLTLAATILHVFTSHRQVRRDNGSNGPT